MNALGVTVGNGLRSPIGKFHLLPNGQPPVRALGDFLNALPADGVESWWAGTQWQDDHRGKGRFLRTFTVPLDLDYHDENGTHEKPVPPEPAARLLEVARSGAFYAQLFHVTPAGARLVYVLPEWLEDSKRYKAAFRGALDRVEKVLEAEKLVAAVRGKDRVSGFVADPAVKDLARVLFAPRIARDNKGRRRDAEVVVLREDPADLEKMEARAPDRRKQRGTARRELTHWIARVRQAPSGERNGTLNKAAFALGQLVAYGALDRMEVERELEAADVRDGEPEVEATKRTICSGLEAGMAKPRPPGRADLAADDRPSWFLNEDLEGAVDFGEKVLAAEGRTYQKDRILVGVLPQERGGAPAIRILADESLLERLATAGRWMMIREENVFPVPPPMWIARTLARRGRWPRIAPLRAIVTAPVLLEDCRVLTTPGYDAASGIMLELDGEYPPPPDVTTANAKDVAATATAMLLDPFSEFPFRDPEGSPGASRAAMLAAVLTPIARHAFDGPAPVFYSASSTQGTGKTLLVRCACVIATGAEPFLTPPPAKDEEMGKVLLTMLIEGTPFAVFDNAVGTFGSKEFSAATTATEYGGRVLGVSRTARGRFLTTMCITGNNVSFVKDTGRRVAPIRLESDREDPEARTFKVRDLPGHVRGRRRELYVAALTILRAFLVAGMPDHGREPMWSSIGWDRLIRGAILWLGVGDPCGGREEIREAADPERDMLRALVATVRSVFGADSFTVGDLTAKANAPGVDEGRLRSALLVFHAKGDAKAELDPNKVGYRLRGWKDRVIGLHDDDGRHVGDFRLARAGKRRDGVLWRIEEVRHA